MNPLSNVKAITHMNRLEVEAGINPKTSWHNKYKGSAWIFVGGLPSDLTEVRDKDSGKSKGYCFICYEDQRSTVLAVDNFNGMKLLNHTIHVDHVAKYQQPKEHETDDKITKRLRTEGIAPKLSPSGSENEEESVDLEANKKLKKEKKAKKKDGKEKKRKRRSAERPDLEEPVIKSDKIKSDFKNPRTKDIEISQKSYRSNEPEDRHTQIKNFDFNEVKEDKNRGREERTIRPRNDNYYIDKPYNRREEDNSFKMRPKERDFKRFREQPRDMDLNRGYNRDRDWGDRNWERGREFNRDRDRNRDYDRKRMKW